MRKGLFLSTLIVLAGALHASALDRRNFLVGWGVVGPAQYDQGEFKGMATANLTGLVSVGESLSFGGVGAAVRCTDAIDSLDEFGLAVPFVTFHRSGGAAQIGVEIQRANLKKNFYYLAVGLTF